MSRLVVVGDSNLYRNATAKSLSLKINRPVTLCQATKLQTLQICMKELAKKPCDTLLVSAISNILCDEVDSSTPEKLSSTAKKAVSTFMNAILGESTSIKQILIVPPIYRSVPKWFVETRSIVLKQLEHECTTSKKALMLPEFIANETDLLPDGVHLHPDAGARFLSYLQNCLLDAQGDSDEFYDAPALDEYGVGETPDKEPTNRDIMNLIKDNIIPKVNEIPSISKRIDELEARGTIRSNQDDIVLARHSEDIDNMKNSAKECRIVVTGVKSAEYHKMSAGDRKSFLSTKMRGLVEQIIGERVFDVYPKRMFNQTDVVPPFEIRFPSREDATKFKLEAYKIAKDISSDYYGLGFHPSVTLATRVRTEILRAISKKLTTDNLSGYCPIYNSRPILHTGPLVDGKVQPKETLNFVDSVLRYRHLLSPTDLTFAYKRVGNFFFGSLSQTFIVLNTEDKANFDKNREDLNQGSTSRGQKRGLADSSRGRGRGKRGR